MMPPPSWAALAHRVDPVPSIAPPAAPAESCSARRRLSVFDGLNMAFLLTFRLR
jgi:hypothetical protein